MQLYTIISDVFQAIAGLGILNVWLIRQGWDTAYRGAGAKNLKEEFAVYGLPPFAYYLIGGLKITCALCLLVTIVFPLPMIILIAAITLAILMIGALIMHINVSDPFRKSLPALAMTIISITIAVLNSNIC